MDNLEKNLNDSKALGDTLTILTMLFESGEKDPALMTDAEFNNLCSMVLIARANINIIKETVNTMDKNIGAAEDLVTIAKFIRGEMNNGSEN